MPDGSQHIKQGLVGFLTAVSANQMPVVALLYQPIKCLLLLFCSNEIRGFRLWFPLSFGVSAVTDKLSGRAMLA